jgi:hypothetical protein
MVGFLKRGGLAPGLHCAALAKVEGSASQGRAADHAAKVAAVKVRLLIGENVGLNIAEDRVRFVLDAIVKRLDDVLADCARQLAVGNRNGLAFDIMSVTP